MCYNAWIVKFQSGICNVELSCTGIMNTACLTLCVGGHAAMSLLVSSLHMDQHDYVMITTPPSAIHRRIIKVAKSARRVTHVGLRYTVYDQHR